MITRITFILLCTFSFSALADPPCLRYLTDAEALSHAADALFTRAESVLRREVSRAGANARPVDLTMSANLQSMAHDLAERLGDENEFVAMFRELSQVFSGARALSTYRREAVIGAVREPKAEHAWKALNPESVNNVWIEDGVYLRKSGEYPNFLTPSMVRELLSRAMGGGWFFSPRSGWSTEILEAENFETMATAPRGGVVYKLEGFTLTHKATGEQRSVIQRIFKPDFDQELQYYRDVARIRRVQPLVVPLAFPVQGRLKVFVRGSTLVKLEWKHDLSLSDVSDLLSKTEFKTKPEIDPDGNTRYLAFAEVNGTPLKIYFQPANGGSPDLLVLRTIFPMDQTRLPSLRED